MLGHLEKTVIDSPDPRRLGEFYCQVLGMTVTEDSADWVVIGSGPDRRELAFQRAGDGWAPPTWPDLTTPQQMHLDIRVTDPDAAEAQLLTLGATRTPAAEETGFRVFTDPDGHPFCIVFGRVGAGEFAGRRADADGTCGGLASNR